MMRGKERNVSAKSNIVSLSKNASGEFMPLGKSAVSMQNLIAFIARAS